MPAQQVKNMSEGLFLNRKWNLKVDAAVQKIEELRTLLKYLGCRHQNYNEMLDELFKSVIGRTKSM